MRAAGGQTLDKGIIAQAAREQWTRVEWFKLLLRPTHLDRELGRAPTTQIPRNKRPVDLIADFLRYMANAARKHFHKTMDADGRIWDEMRNRITYILSHPNGWNTSEHSIMRDAAIMAELVPNTDQGQDNIIFVSEGEASLHWCMSKGIGRGGLEVGSQFIVVDAGGGTIGISTFKAINTIPLEFEESHIPEFYLQGSAFVTKAFRNYVEDKLRDSSFGDPDSIDRLVEDFDLQVKRNFRRADDDLHVRFGRHQDNDPRFGITAGELRVRGERMAQFFEPACHSIDSSVKAIVGRGKATVVLVGGFAGNSYLCDEVKRRLSGPNIQVLSPNDASAKASANGVICFYLDRSVKARIAKWSYGIPCVHDFDPKDPKHLARKSRVQTNPATGKQFIEGGFLVTLKKGTVVQETELTRFPFWHSQSTQTAATLEIVLESYQGDVPDIKFRDEDREAGKFQELCWFKAVIPETSLVRKAQKVKSKNALLRSRHYYYVSNFNIVVSFGATELKCYIEWKDAKGKITRQSILPIWGDSSIDSPFKSQYPPEKQILLKQDSSSSTNVKELSRKTETHQEKDPVTQQSSPRLSTLSLSTEDLESIATEELGSIVTLSQMDGYLQRDRERPPRLTQPQQPSGTSTKLKDVVPTLVQSSEIRDKSISKAETRGSDLASVRPPLAWEGVVKEFQFLNSQSVCTPSLIGAYDDWVVSASSGVLLFTLSSRAVLYSTVRKTGREIHYGLHVKSSSSVAHNLSPDGKTLIRWISSEEKKGNRLVAIDVRSKQQKAQLQRDYQYQQCDILNARWVDDSTIYIPVSKEGIVILWTIHDSRYNLLEDSFVRPEDPVIIQPFASIICHSQLKFKITKDRAWWIATGMTPSDSPSGLIEVHDVENDESRIVEGMVSCIAEVDVYDEEKALLVSASLTPDSKLQLCVQQVDPSASGQPFIPVDVKVDSIEEKDYPRDIIILHPFPIVALMTEKFYIYFFELNTGAYLFSQAQNPYKFCPSQSNEHGLWIWSHEKSDVRALTINKDDLIGYCRQVLGDDRLASTIAIRTGLRGAEDVILDDMYGRYQDVVGCAPEP